MTIFEIGKEIENLLNLVNEDGEVDDETFAKLMELQQEKDEKLENESRVCVSYRRTKTADYDDGFIAWCLSNGKTEFLRYKEPTVDRVALKEYLKNHELDNARIVESVSMSVK